MDAGVELGDRYREELRVFLNEQGPFPANARVTAAVFERSDLVLSMDRVGTFPKTIRDGQHRKHAFILCGFEFALHVGNRLPDGYEELCLAHGATKRLMVLAPEKSGTALATIKMGANARPSTKLAAWARRRRKKG